tara:strand:- start:72433 stop:74613 length:2181 start_codon:yes stop_codon:yes gene_type:complete
MAEAMDEAHIKQHEYHDPLLECLVLISKMKQQPCSAEALRAGLPLVNNRLTPDLFIRAAERGGFIARYAERPLRNISPLVLPAVIMTKDGGACVLTKLKKNKACVVFPETEGGVNTISLKELEEQYSGFIFLVQVKEEFEKRAEQDDIIKKPRLWFWGTLWKFRNYYGQVIFASFFVNLFAVASPLFIMNVYDRVVPNNAIETLWVLAIGVTIVFGFDFILKTLRSYFIDFASKKVDILLGSRLFEQALGIRMEHRAASTGVQAMHLRDFETVRDFFTSATIAGLVDLPFVFLFIALIYFIGGFIAIVPLITAPFIIISAILISIPLNHLVNDAYVGGAQKHAIMIESLNNIDVIKSLTAEGQILSRWEKFVAMTADAGLKTRFYSALATNITTVTVLLTSVFVVITGVYLIQANELTVGGLIACTILSTRALSPLGQITALLTRYQMTKVSLAALNTLMELPQERPTTQKFLHRPTLKGEIVFDDVSFRYPDTENDLLKGVSFRINPHEKVALVGNMGSGKTTIFNLIMGFYQPTNGAIKIDGTDISQIDPADLRRNLGYVQQEPKVFFGSVRDNIAVRAPWVDDTEILRAAQAAGAYNFIGAMPNGFDALIGENGVGLSGGQIQTITVARALLMSPSIMLFDEPSSSMDNSTEAAFVKNMQETLKDKTAILVTHKIPLLQIVSRILVLQHGKIIADGPKDKVLEFLQQVRNERSNQEQAEDDSQ